MNPLVSVALCTYNGAAFLEKQLYSICIQNYKPIELVVVDDASTDDTVKIVESFANKINLKLYQNEHNLGFVRNFEKALSLCTGDYIALCDQDDIWQENKLTVILSAIGNNLFAYSDAELIDAQGLSMNKKVSDVVNPILSSNPLPLLLNNCTPGNTMVFKRELLEFAFPFPDNFYHDWWLLYIAATKGSIAYVPTPLVKYRQHAANVTNMTHHKRENRKNKENKQARAARTLNHLKAFQQFNQNQSIESPILDRLIYLFENKGKHLFDLKLFDFLMQHRQELYYILKKNNFKKNHRIFKECLNIG